MALIGNIVVRRPGELEVYAETADLHECYCRTTLNGVIHPLKTRCAPPPRAGDWSKTPALPFGPTIVRWYPVVQWFDGAGGSRVLPALSRGMGAGRTEPPPVLRARIQPPPRTPFLDGSLSGHLRSIAVSV